MCMPPCKGTRVCCMHMYMCMSQIVLQSIHIYMYSVHTCTCVHVCTHVSVCRWVQCVYMYMYMYNVRVLISQLRVPSLYMDCQICFGSWVLAVLKGLASCTVYISPSCYIYTYGLPVYIIMTTAHVLMHRETWISCSENRYVQCGSTYVPI